MGIWPRRKGTRTIVIIAGLLAVSVLLVLAHPRARAALRESFGMELSEIWEDFLGSIEVEQQSRVSQAAPLVRHFTPLLIA